MVTVSIKETGGGVKMIEGEEMGITVGGALVAQETSTTKRRLQTQKRVMSISIIYLR
jgi:hypothetical protein